MSSFGFPDLLCLETHYIACLGDPAVAVLCHSCAQCDKGTGAEQTLLSRGMGFLTVWYVRPAKPQISLRIRAF